MAKTKIQYSQDIVEVEEIKNGVVKTKDGRYVKIVEISPINFHLRSEREKNAIIVSFAQWLKIAPVKIQFKVISKATNVNKYVESIKSEMLRETNPACQELQQDYIMLLNSVGASEGVARRFFLCFEYSKMGIGVDTFEDIVYTLNSTVMKAKSMLKHCGNKIIEYEDEDMFLLQLFYELYNRVQHTTIAEKMKYAIDNKYGNEEINASDILAPYFIHIDNDYMVVNDTYYSFLYIPSAKYATAVSAGWLSGIINAGEGVDLDLYFEKEDKAKIKKKLGQQIRINKSKIKDTQDTNDDFDDLSNAINAGYYMRQGLNENEDFYYMNAVITVTASSLDELRYKIDALESMLVSQDLEVRTAKYHMLDAYKSVIPLCSFAEKIKSRAKRNILTYGAASTYVFSSFEISDDNGILLGVNQQNNSLCVIDLYNSEKYKNANMSILGTSGAGKTFLLQTMALRLRMKNTQVFIIAPLKGHEFRRSCNAIGGEYIKISPGSKNCINILEIRPLDKSVEKELDGSEELLDSILAKKVSGLEAFFSLIIPDMSYEEKQLLDSALIKAYESKGITHNNDSLIDYTRTKPGDKLPTYKEMPILEDVYNFLIQIPKTERIANILNRFVHGSASSFNGQTNVNLDNKYVVVDISDFATDELQAIGMFVALDFIYDKVKEDRTKKKAVFIDETWKLIGSGSNELAANFVLEIFKIIRGYGGSAIAATQDINDFFALEGGKYGRGIISNSKTKIILQLEPEEADTVQDVFDLSDSETLNIVRFERGSGLLIVNSNNVPVKIKASLKEEELITTDRARLEEIVAQRQMMKFVG